MVDTGKTLRSPRSVGIADKREQSNAQLLAWATEIVAREQSSSTYGKIVVHMEKGRIMRVVVEKNEMPPQG